jgi:peptidoglycan hydrolase-like protein with peptidoglycan-binding domain
MAYKKQVAGRAYPHLYNLHKTVGSRKAMTTKSEWVEETISSNPGMGTWGRPKTTTTYTASHEPNRRDDVMLVQLLLKRVYQRGNAAEPPLNQGNGTILLKIDGMYGPKTQRAIEQFQIEMARNGRSIAADGCVDPEMGDSATSSISQTGYTISWLNKYFFVLWPDLFADIRIDPECPMELRVSLSNGGL